MPLVSITMPAYNTAAYIGEAVRSCLAQTWRDWELLVVDDGSTDGTLDAAKAAAAGDLRVRFFSIPHGGWPEARNVAFRESRGEFIARLDSDDSQHPDRLRLEVELLARRPAVDCVTTGVAFIKDGELKPARLGPMRADGFMRGKSGHAPCNGSILASREFYAQVGRFGGEYLCGEDTDWNRRANLLGARWAHVDQPLYYHRRRAGQLTGMERGLRVNMKRPVDWKANGQAWDKSMYRHLEIVATVRCNLECPLCSATPMRQALPDYEMKLSDVDRLIQRVEELEIHVGFFEITGGEPLLWPHLKAATEMVKAAGIADSIHVRTNGFLLDERIMAELPAVDLFRVSAYSGTRGLTQEGRIRRQFVRMKRPLAAPMPEMLPAFCNCNRFLVVGRRIGICGNAWSHSISAGLSLDDPTITCSIDEDWVRHFRRVDKSNLPICAWCLANRRIWKAMPYA